MNKRYSLPIVFILLVISFTFADVITGEKTILIGDRGTNIILPGNETLSISGGGPFDCFAHPGHPCPCGPGGATYLLLSSEAIIWNSIIGFDSLNLFDSVNVIEYGNFHSNGIFIDDYATIDLCDKYYTVVCSTTVTHKFAKFLVTDPRDTIWYDSVFQMYSPLTAATLKWAYQDDGSRNLATPVKSEEINLNFNYKFTFSPNPVNQTTAISYSLQKPALVSVGVYSTSGKRLAVLGNGRQEAGSHSLSWNTNGWPGGVYLIRLEAGGMRTVKKALVIK